MEIAILTGGGDAPGLNPVIRAVAKVAHENTVEMIGLIKDKIQNVTMMFYTIIFLKHIVIRMMKLKLQNPFTLLKDRSTRPLSKTLLLCAAPMLILGRLIGAIIFTFMIMSHATEKSSIESPKPLTEEIRL